MAEYVLGSITGIQQGKQRMEQQTLLLSVFPKMCGYIVLVWNVAYL